MIEGYEDLGHLGRSSRPAKLAFVIMIRGLYNKMYYLFIIFFIFI